MAGSQLWQPIQRPSGTKNDDSSGARRYCQLAGLSASKDVGTASWTDRVPAPQLPRKPCGLGNQATDSNS